MLLCIYSALYAPPVVVPNLNTPVFNATSMDQTFNVANGMQTVGNWDAFVFQGVSILQTQWEAQVQAQITMMVNSVTTSDHYASVQEYQTFVYNSLQSKASEQLIVWQTAVEAEILQERSQYLSQKYGANSSAVQNSTSQFQSQWDSFVSGNGLNLNTNGSLSQAVLNNGQQTLEGLEGQWWNDFQNNLQSGLQTYQQALAGLTEKYQNLINQINQTELQYQAHLAQIQQSQAGIKDQILSSLEGYQSYLNSNGLFWNTMSVVYDNSTGSYAQGSCPGGHVCVTYQYDSVTSQFYTAGNCPVGHVCANILYDNNTSSYVQASCPGGHICDGSQRESLTVRTGLNSDGRAFQSVINNVVNAMQDGFIMPAIFDYTTGTMISYNSNCMNTGTSCVKGLYDATSGGFVAGTTCAAGHTCYSAVVDNTNPAAMTGSYFANSCTVGDTRCVTCQAGHSCQVQDMEASFMYASSMMSNFLHNELLATQGALQSAINYQNGSGSSSYTYGQGVGSYDNSALSYQWGPSSFNHFSANVSQTTAAMTISELFDPSTTEGEGGLGKKIIQYITGQISQVEFANWIMNAYESNLTGAGSGLSGLGGLGPGMTISGISHADLRAFLNEDIPPANSGVNQYCPDPIGCYSGNIFAPDPGIYGANATFSERGYDFNRYIARELGVWAGVPFLVDIEHYQDYAWIELSFTVTNNNAYANVSTYQDLVLQLQSFEHDWMTNVMPSVTNWTAQVASYNAQYANWQTQMQTAITDAQNAYNSGVQDIQNQESSWLAQMGQLQQQAQSAFDAASNALKNGQGQGNYGQLTQQILAGLNKGQLQSNISNSTDTMQYGDGFSNILNNLDRNADRGIPNFSLLNSFGSSMSRAITGVSNLTLLSSTNNALMDNILGYMQGVAESMRNEKQFTQNGQQDLMEAHGLKTKTIKTRDKYSGEEISTTYVLDESGNIRMFKDEDGVEKQMTVGDWIQSDEGCGKNLMNGNCNQYIENKYDSVAISTDGKITAHRKIYNGTTTQCGADFAQSSSYCYNEDDRVITIAPPNPKALLLGRGASRLGDIFDGRDNGIGDLVNTTFQNVGTYLSSNKHTADLFHEVITAQNLNDMNASIASQDVSNKVKIANLIVDYAQAVLLGGMSTGSWVTKQANQAVQDVISTALVNTFDLPPDVAAFISGGLMAHMEASKAKHDLGTKNFGIGKGIHSAFNDLGLEGLESALIHAAGPILDVLIFPGAGAISKSTLDSYGNDLDSMHKWKEFKTSMYGFAVQKIGEQQHWSPEFTSFASQYAMDYIEMKEAKAELGRNGAAFSLNSIAGEVKLAIANVGGAFGEYLGGIVNGAAHISGDLGLTSERYEKEINQQVRTSINDIKLKGYKDNIRNWDADQVGLASATVKEYGRVNHIDQATIDLWSQQASDFVVRKQAERDLHRRESQMLTATVLTGGLAGVLVLDNKLFSGGLTSLVSKGIKGVMTTIADVGNLLGEGVVSSSFRDSVYDQSKQWHKTITQEDVKARTQQGIINKAHIESEMRNQLFDVIGETLIPGDKEAAHNLGLLLKHHIDQKEAKKAAKEQRLRDAQTVVQVAAAAAMVACSAGTTGPLAGTWLSGLTTAASTTVAGTTVTLTYGQIAALAVSTAVSMGVEGSINGTNGAVAAFANGLISAATMGIKTPVTGYVTYTKHQNANLLTGQHEVKGGWGGGFSANIAGSKALPLGEAMQAFAAAMKMSNLSLGLSYNRDAGLGMNVNANFTNHLGLGLDYNFKSGDYTASASYDFDKIGDKDWANASLGISASKNGHASASISYNTDGNTAIPQALRGSGATLDFGNDGLIGLSVQAMRGATIGTLTYDTNTHGFQPLTLNSNYQNEFNQGQAAENAAYNHQKGQMEILRKELGLGTNMDKPLFTDAEIDKALPKDEHGNIDMEKANPEKLLEKWNAHKEAMSKTPEGLQKWKDEVSKAGERSGIEVRFNDGKSATTTFGKFVTGLMGDVAQSFGFANDGSKMVDEQGVFHLDTCFVAGTSIRMDSGFKAIEDVKIGDVIRSWNENTNTFENKRVTETFVHEVPQLFFLELDGEEEIHTTWNHPFRRKTQNTQEVQPFDLRGVERSFTTHEHVMNPSGTVLQKRNAEETASLSSEWVKVEDLRLRDQVLRSDGSWGTVTGIYYYNTESTKVYNLEVEDNHTYIVGGSETGKGYVVHNYSKEHEQMFGKIGNFAKEVFGVAKVVGGEAYEKAVVLQQEITSSNGLRESLKLESNALNLQKDKAEAGLELNKRRNSEFLAAIHNSESDNLPGISELRKQLRNVDPVKGFTREQMKAVSSWMHSSGSNSNLVLTGAAVGGMMLTSSPMKGYITATAAHITGIEEHTKLTDRLKETNQKLAEHRVKEEHLGRQMLERTNQAKSALVKVIQERYGNDPRFSEVLVEHGLVERSQGNLNESKVSYTEKLKAFGDKIGPENKRLGEINQKLTDLRVSQNKREAADYENWKKNHPNEPYKRSPEMETHRNDTLTQQKNLERERSNLINREVLPYKNEGEIRRLEGLADQNKLTNEQRTELTKLRNERKAHEIQVAALFDKDTAKLHSELEKIDLKTSKPMTVSTTMSRFENETIHKLRSKDNPATKELTWEGKTYQRNVNNQTGEVNFEREYKPGVKEEISVTDSGQIKQKLTWDNIFGKPQESVKVFDANGKFLTELSGNKPATVETSPNEKVTIKPNEPQGPVQRSDLNEVKNLISNGNLSSKERLSKINTLDELEVNGKRYVKETVVTENVKTKNTKEKVTFFTLQNENGKSERISFEEVDSGYKDSKGKPIKTIEMVQVQSEGTVAEDTKRFDRFGNEKPDQDHAGNYPTIEENPKYYLERAKQIFKEKGIQAERDSNGNLMSYNGRPELVRVANNGFINISSITQTQRDQSYLGQTNKEGKPVLYSLPGNRDGDVKDSSACQSHAPSVVMASLGYKMTPEQINQYGKLNVMTTRLMAEAGQMLPHKPRPSEMSIQEISDLVLKPLGFEVPPGNEGALIAWGEDRPKEPNKDKYEFDPDGYEKAKDVYKQELRAFKLKFQEEHLNAWITKQLEKGNIVVSGADFTKGGHVGKTGMAVIPMIRMEMQIRTTKAMMER
ncbi:toxin HINT domain protein [Leptospira kirschneri serovar Sokoine str. RM1]|nr:toxin HINT domain protein [Leptospira kirschneri serovar Sokoine str. RM1]